MIKFPLLILPIAIFVMCTSACANPDQPQPPLYTPLTIRTLVAPYLPYSPPLDPLSTRTSANPDKPQPRPVRPLSVSTGPIADWRNWRPEGTPVHRDNEYKYRYYLQDDDFERLRQARLLVAKGDLESAETAYSYVTCSYRYSSYRIGQLELSALEEYETLLTRMKRPIEAQAIHSRILYFIGPESGVMGCPGVEIRRFRTSSQQLPQSLKKGGEEPQ